MESASYREYRNPNAPLQRLRWEQDGVSYEIVAFGGGLTLDELVSIAESF